MQDLNKFHSYNLGSLPRGCQMCVRGEKLVLFVTGLCPRKCYFCPLSDKKYGKDVIYANERKSFDSKEVIEEAELMDAKGMGVTGGDPLMKIDRTIRYIKTMKNKFGKDFHVHLYTSLNLVKENNLQLLYQAGLDEIRFHFDFGAKTFWKNIEKAYKFPWDVGVEVPLVPNKEKIIKEIIDLIQGKVRFLNLNELEVADNELSKLGEMGFKVKDTYSYAIKGSLELGLELIDYVKENEYPLAVHVCTAKLKDSVQLANRIKREAEGVKKKFDLVDSEGMLTRGALYLPELAPGASYRKKLEEVDAPKSLDDKDFSCCSPTARLAGGHLEVLRKLSGLVEEIKKKVKLEDEDLFIDKKKYRILLSKKNAKKHHKVFSKLGLKTAVVVEYPTADQLEIELDFL